MFLKCIKFYLFSSYNVRLPLLWEELPDSTILGNQKFYSVVLAVVVMTVVTVTDVAISSAGILFSHS